MSGDHRGLDDDRQAGHRVTDIFALANDGPCFYATRDPDGNRWLVLLVDRPERESRLWLYRPVSWVRFEQLRGAWIDARQAFAGPDPGSDPAAHLAPVLVTDRHGLIVDRAELTGDIPVGWLPPDGLVVFSPALNDFGGTR